MSWLRDQAPEGLFARVIRRERRKDERKCRIEQEYIEKLEAENAELKRRIEELEDEDGTCD